MSNVLDAVVSLAKDERVARASLKSAVKPTLHHRSVTVLVQEAGHVLISEEKCRVCQASTEPRETNIEINQNVASLPLCSPVLDSIKVALYSTTVGVSLPAPQQASWNTWMQSLTTVICIATCPRCWANPLVAVRACMALYYEQRGNTKFWLIPDSWLPSNMEVGGGSSIVNTFTTTTTSTPTWGSPIGASPSLCIVPPPLPIDCLAERNLYLYTSCGAMCWLPNWATPASIDYLYYLRRSVALARRVSGRPVNCDIDEDSTLRGWAVVLSLL
uniref:Herpesvirus helicase-primase complex component domain-containing protein n=1 Tax=Otarine gammaherpesvirus 4 TaxID=2801541 RepID=A0A889IW50_9GAMA|nr:hypothetical protein [Otarine gammaherpesvirus 4]